MSKHTPGPWSAKDRDNQISIPLKSIDCERIGFSVCFVNGHREQEAKANARLIAAAPELLRELQEARIALCLMLSYHGQGSADYADAAQVRAQVAIDGSGAAIAKATGEQQ